MSVELALALGRAAPIYNLGLAVAVILLFVRLFRTPPVFRNIYLKPWKIIFVAFGIFILEEVITILRQAGIINIPVHINGFFELAIIAVFIYTLLLQKEHVQTHHKF